MFEVIGRGEYCYYDTFTVDIGIVATLEQARQLVQQYSDYQFSRSVTHKLMINVVEDYQIFELNVGTTFLDTQPIRHHVESIVEPRLNWYSNYQLDLADADYMTGEDQDLLFPPNDGEWIQHQYDTVNRVGKYVSATSYVWTNTQRKIRDVAQRMCKRIKHKR